MASPRDVAMRHDLRTAHRYKRANASVTINRSAAGASMNASDAVAHIHWLAVAVAGIIGFPRGALCYGPLFGGAWMAATGITADRVRQSNKGKIYGTTLLLNIVIATSLAMFI